MKLYISTHAMAAAIVLSTTALAGCSSPSRPTEHGTSNTLVFPDVKDAWTGDGTFPSVEHLKLLAPGMTKDQLYALVGRPHFETGMFNVREWDYLFNFRTDMAALDHVVKCQMKVLFDKDMLSRSYHWSPEACSIATIKAAAISSIAPDRRFPIVATSED